MRVRYLFRDAGPDGVHQPYTEAEVSDAEGKRLVLGGWAEEVEPPKRELPRTAKKARTAKPPEGRAAAEEEGAAWTTRCGNRRRRSR